MGLLYALCAPSLNQVEAMVRVLHPDEHSLLIVTVTAAVELFSSTKWIISFFARNEQPSPPQLKPALWKPRKAYSLLQACTTHHSYLHNVPKTQCLSVRVFYILYFIASIANQSAIAMKYLSN